MSDRTPHRRALAGSGVALALALGGSLAVGGSPAASAPVADCATPFPIADLGRGDVVRGLTVTSGTVPQPFGGEVLGVLDDGIAPGLDMVMVEVDPTGLDVDRDEVKGIWQGMSGSPVYADDGRLIGAVAYGLGYGEQSWVAGVTPFEDMDDYLSAGKAAGKAPLGRAAAAQGFEPLPMPLAVSGASSRFLRHSDAELEKHPWLRTDAYVAGRAAAALDDDTIVAGGNMAASLSYGDILMAGVGTVTSVCDGEVVGFGHPAAFAGDTTMGLHPADVLYVQGSMPSFKVANIGGAVGTIFGDHTTGITGRFGVVPETTPVSSSVTWGERSRTGTTQVAVPTLDNLAYLTYLQVAMNHSRVVDGAVNGSEVYTWDVTGTDADGTPFTLSWTDRLLSYYDLADEAAMAAAMAVEQIAAMRDVEIDAVDVTGTASASTDRVRLKRVEQRVAGSWVRISPRRPAMVRAGGTFAVRAIFVGGAEDVVVPFTFEVPRRAKGITSLAVVGGLSTYLDLGGSIEAAEEGLATAVRSDVARAQFGRVSMDDVGYGGGEYFGVFFKSAQRPRGPKFLQTRMSQPADTVMSGVTMVPVLIR